MTVRKLNRLETLGETFRAALNSLATVAPEWLINHLQSDWFDRYSRRIENYSQETPEFLKIYNQRAGVEATLSQGIRRTSLRRSHYIGLAKTHLQHILIATALNLIRLDAWLNDVPIAKTRISRFKKLQQ